MGFCCLLDCFEFRVVLQIVDDNGCVYLEKDTHRKVGINRASRPFYIDTRFILIRGCPLKTPATMDFGYHVYSDWLAASSPATIDAISFTEFISSSIDLYML